MSSIALAIFKHTIGLLVNKGRDKAAEKLKDGDVTDQKFRDLIVREIDDIKSKLDGLSRKDLLASISFFKEGIELLYEVFDKASSRSSFGAVTASATRAEKVCFAEEIKNLELSDLDESEKRKLNKAKKSFEEARIKATEAFNNEALRTSDRILAMQYRVMAAILETVDNPADALAKCRVCIDELHSMPAVKNSFDAQLKKGNQTFRGLFRKEERREIFFSVCHMNRVIYDITLVLGQGLSVSACPVVDTGKEEVDLWWNERVEEVMCEHGMQHCIVEPWSFGLEGKEKHELRKPWSITTNSSGEFIVGELEGGFMKVFDSGGNFVNHFSVPDDDINSMFIIIDVATDMHDNIFVLNRLKKPRTDMTCWVYKLTKAADLSHKFRLRGDEDWYQGLSVSETGKLLTLREASAVEEYDTEGAYVRRYGEGILHNASDITIANDSRVLVADGDDVYIFSEHGDYLRCFQLQNSLDNNLVMLTYHRVVKHVVVVYSTKQLLHLEIYTNNGEFVRSAQIQRERYHVLRGITLTTDGRIAVILSSADLSKVLVV